MTHIYDVRYLKGMYNDCFLPGLTTGVDVLQSYVRMKDWANKGADYGI